MNSVFDPTNQLGRLPNLIDQLIPLLHKRSHFGELVHQTATFQALAFCTCNGLDVDADKQESYRNGHQHLVQGIPDACDYESHVIGVHPITHVELGIDLSLHRYGTQHDEACLQLLGHL